MNDALLGRGEVAAFDPGVETPVTAEHVVDDEENQVRVEHEQGRTAQGFGCDQVEVGGDHQITDEFAVLLNADRADRNLRVAVHVVEQANTQIAGKTLVDEFERGHAPTHDAFLGA